MKLTWFAGTTIRLHIGGSIIVFDAAGAPPEVERHELVSGADRQLQLGGEDDLPPLDMAAGRRRRRAGSVLDADAARPQVEVERAGPTVVLVAAAGEPPVALVAGDAAFGRWLDDAVVVLFGPAAGLVARGSAVLDAARPRLVALAAADDAVEQAMPALGARLGDAALVALEPGLALEV